MRNWIIIAVITLIFGLTIFTTFYLYQQRIGGAIFSLPNFADYNLNFLAGKNPTFKPTPVGFAKITPPSPSPGVVLGSQPATGGGSKGDDGIVVLAPHQQDLISSPVDVIGWSKILDGKITVMVRDKNGQILAQTQLVTCANYQVCPFNAQIAFNGSTTETGTIELTSQPQNPSQFSQSIVIQFR